MSEPIFSNQETEKLFAGWNIVGVSVRAKDSFYFLLREAQEDEESSKPDMEYKTRCVGYFGFLPSEQSKIASFDIEYFNRPGMATHFNGATQVVVVKANGEAFARGAGKEGMEEVHEGVKININKVKSLLGNVYAVGTDRDIYRRSGIGTWEDIRYEIPKPKSADEWKRTGFKDIAAFANGDLYAVGGEGDVWHFSSRTNKWVQCKFPFKTPLFNVVCAPDGYVYIGAERGTIYKGKETTWTTLWEGNFSIPYNDMLWFNKQLCASSDYGFYRLLNGAMTRSNEEPYMGHMDAHDGVLLLATDNHAWLYDGQQWKILLEQKW
jgi:hypothetical protein